MTMTRLQDATCDRLALREGRLAVRDGYADGDVRASVPSGESWIVGEDGVPRPDGTNFSIDWSQS